MKKILLSFLTCLLTAFCSHAGGSYVKVTEAPSDWSGDYLIVYEDGAVAFNGGLETLDAAQNYISVTISNGEIASTEDTDAAKFTIAASGTGYTIKSASGYYIGRTATTNGLNSNKTTAYINTISCTNGVVTISSSGGPTLQYYKSGANSRFRYYKTSQTAIALYKYTEAGSDDLTDPELAWSESAVTTIMGDEFSAPTLTNKYGLSVTYSSSNTEVATVDEAGTVQIVGAGTATIKAASEATDTYSADSASYSLTVIGKVATLTDFIDAAPAVNTMISAPVTVFYQYGSYTFITDGTSNLLVYGTLSNTYANGDVLTGIIGTYTEYIGMAELIPDTSSFGDATEGSAVEPTAVTLADEIAPADYVTLTGVSILEETADETTTYTLSDGTNSLAIYNRFAIDLYAVNNATVVGIGAVYNTTKQLYIISIEGGTALVDPEIKWSTQNIVVAYLDEENELPTLSTPDELEDVVTYSSSNEDVATINAETGEITLFANGTTTITASYPGDSKYNAASVSYELYVLALGEIYLNESTDSEVTLVLGETATFTGRHIEGDQSTFSYNVNDGEEISGQYTWTPTEIGTYTIKAIATWTPREITHTKTATFTINVVAESTAKPAYVKVTSTPSDWAGRYLIVCEDAAVALNGALTTIDAVENNVSVTINEGIIEATDALAEAEFIIAASGDYWSIKSASGYYIGNSTKSNGLKSSNETVYINEISLEDSSIQITAKDHTTPTYLRFNSASDQMRFRYYTSATSQKDIALYKYDKKGIATAITEVENVCNEPAQWFDLNGRRVAAPAKGIYILRQGGKTSKHAF